MARYGKSTVGFIKAVNQWTRETEERSREAFQDAVKDMYDETFKNTPYDTGALRNSLIVYKDGQPGPHEVTGPDGGHSGAAVSYMNADSLELGDRAKFAYGRTYWRRLEYGFVGSDSLGRFYNQAGRFFLQYSMSKWRSIVRAAATRHRMRMK